MQHSESVARLSHPPFDFWNLRGWVCVATVLLLNQYASADPPQRVQPVTVGSFEIARLEESLQSVAQENAKLAEEVRNLKAQVESSTVASTQFENDNAFANNEFQPNLPTYDPSLSEDAARWSAHGLVDSPTGSSGSHKMVNYFATYDRGITLRPHRFDESPFSLKVNFQNTFRYTGFSKDADFWVDSTGVSNPIQDSSQFGIPRGRLILSGNAFKEDVSYLLSIDYNTVNNNPIGFRAYALSYRVSRALQLHVGQNKVPGTREWLNSSFDTQQGPDRSMATTFFRPSLSQGIWLTGEPCDGLNYHAMVSNGFNTLNLNTSQLNNRYCISESVWWEPWGDFGRGYSDLENHSSPVIRLGNSWTYSLETGSQSSNYPENSSIRLSDGTLITQEGALAPNVTLESFNLSLLALDAAWKYRGWGLSTEIYRQGLNSLSGNGPLQVSSLTSYGGVAQIGTFVIPQKVELYSRNSYVTGAYGSGTEIGAGLNCFPIRGRTSLRFTFDVAWLDSSPADQNRTGFVAGQSGYLFRTQLASSF
jgi:hypothetical protein